MKKMMLLSGVFILAIGIVIFLICAFIWGKPGIGVDDALKSPIVRAQALGVCPPFPLRDEQGKKIGVNDTVPYSPKRTCGAPGCHDYAKITEGFHFTQGKGESLPKEFAARYNWVTSPGNYGGAWCSPAPLYRQLAPKKNTSARTIDMTSFDFVTATCGNCHPGGGPLEYDREGKRYDAWMRDPASGFIPGADNGLDGDYFKARWSETGVIEADCLLCHMTEYNLEKRNAELANLNFRWAATAGAGFGTVTGKVSSNEQPAVTYDKTRFDADGNVLIHITPEPRNETCLRCHAKPDWKKRGAAFSVRTDVHMMAGLHCVDCHAAGSKAADPRVRKKNMHQFGKGDDPSGWVRNDLDNTVRSCENCHIEGWRNAPRAKHAWLPPLHMEKIACQTCHIPTRAVKSALVQASDVFNAAPRIAPPPKHIWTFYDQERDFWNHYGELDLFTAKNQPTNITRPSLFRYKGKIYPGNRVHSAWVGFDEHGKPGLNQLFMKDFFKMWMQHRADPKNNFPELAKITDDNHDGALEVNRTEEIDALLASVKAYLALTGFPMEGRRLVWVSDARAYYSSKEFRQLPHKEWEATAYASVYKLSHDVAPARAALGAGGCTDCHRKGSPFFQGAVLDAAFSPTDARPQWIPNYQILGISPFWVRLGTLREGFIKPALYAFIGVIIVLFLTDVLGDFAVREGHFNARLVKVLSFVALAAALICGIITIRTPGLLEYMIVSRFSLDAHHFWIACSVLLSGLPAVIKVLPPKHKEHFLLSIMRWCGWGVLGIAGVSGALMLVKFALLETLTKMAYTLFDMSLLLSAIVTSILLLLRIIAQPPSNISFQPEEHDKEVK